MALKGSLEDFPLTDVFQLLGQQQKSGALLVRKDGKVLRLVFFEGQLVLGNAKGDPELLFGNLLKLAQVLSEEDLQKALEMQKSSSRSIGDILIKEKYISPKLFTEFIALQLDEILFELFSWERGEYEFVADTLKLNAKLFKMQRPEGALMEQFRRKDEWPGIKSKIGSSKHRFMQNPAKSSEAAALDHPQAKAIFNQMNEPRSVEEVGFRLRIGRFEAGAAVAKLLEAGCLTAKGLKKDITTREVWLLPRTMIFVFTASLLFGLLFFSPYAYYFSQGDNSQSKQAVSSQLQIQDLADVNRIQQMRMALHSYWLKHRTYPDSLTQIGLSKREAKHWVYQAQQDDFKLNRKESLP